MNIAVCRTGHIIADTVAEALGNGFRRDNDTRVAIGYGILRGMDANLRKYQDWFLVDNGYFNPGHFDGYYRISYKGTQAQYDPLFSISQNYNGEIKPWKKYDHSKPVLVCPPTDHVRNFFNLPESWTLNAIAELKGLPVVVREKGTTTPINWDDYSACLTFNSSVGWDALINGVPCLSDPQHSVVGSYYPTKSIDSLLELINTKPRKPLFDFMRSHQFTLAEIAKGDAQWLIDHYLSKFTLDMMDEKQLLPMSLPTPLPSGLQSRFQSNI